MIASIDSTSKPLSMHVLNPSIELCSDHNAPPSYVSHLPLENGAPPRTDLNRAATPTPDGIRATFRNTGDSDSALVPLEQSTSGTNSTVTLLTMRLEERSALTQRSGQFEEIERSARRLFDLDDSVSLCFTAEIPSFDNERMIVDPHIWSIVGKEISNVWITISPLLRRPSKSTAETHAIEVHIANRYAKTHVFQVQVSRTATIGDLKRAITKRKPKYQVVDLTAQSYLQGSAAGSDVMDEALAHQGRYHFLYDELAFIAHMRAEPTKQHSSVTKGK